MAVEQAKAEMHCKLAGNADLTDEGLTRAVRSGQTTFAIRPAGTLRVRECSGQVARAGPGACRTRRLWSCVLKPSAPGGASVETIASGARRWPHGYVH